MKELYPQYQTILPLHSDTHSAHPDPKHPLTEVSQNSS